MGLKASWRRCYYPHRLRNSVSPVCGIFSFIFRPKEGSFGVEVGWCNCSAILSVMCFFVYFLIYLIYLCLAIPPVWAVWAV